MLVTRASAALASHVSASVSVGGIIFDTATLSGGANPTGTIVFRLYGAGDITCARPPVFTSTRPVSGDSSYSSDPFTATATGNYRFVAGYSGDANNFAVSGVCGVANETVPVTGQAATGHVLHGGQIQLPFSGGDFG